MIIFLQAMYVPFSDSFKLFKQTELTAVDCLWVATTQFILLCDFSEAGYQRQNRHHWVTPEIQTQVLAPTVLRACFIEVHSIKHNPAVNCRWLQQWWSSQFVFSDIKWRLESDVRRLIERLSRCYGCGVNVSIACEDVIWKFMHCISQIRPQFCNCETKFLLTLSYFRF